MQVVQLPVKIPTPWGANALSPYIRTIPSSSQIGIQNGAASWPDGFPAWTFQPNGFPFGQDFNGVLNTVTQWNRWHAAGGPLFYDSAFATATGGYPSGAILQSVNQGGLFWYNVADNNTTNPDGVGAANWIAFNLATPTSIIHYGVDTGSVNAIVATTSPPTLSLQSGMIFEITAVAANTIATPTANFDGHGAKLIQRWDGSLLQPGDILPAPYKALFAYDSTADNLFLLNPGNLLKAPPILTAPLQYYVNGTTGSDSNNGLTTLTPFQTIQKGLNAAGSVFTNGFPVTISVVASGTYGHITLPPINGAGSVILVGNNSTPTNCVISGNTFSAIFAGAISGTYQISGFSLVSTGNPSLSNDICGGIFLASGGGAIFINNMDFGACSGGHIAASGGSTIGILQGPITISGGCIGNSVSSSPAHMNANTNANIHVGIPATFPSLSINAAAFMSYFASVSQGGSIAVAYSSISNPTNVTATKFSATLNGTVNSGGRGTSYYPGNVAGTTSTGGQYA